VAHTQLRPNTILPTTLFQQLSFLNCQQQLILPTTQLRIFQQLSFLNCQQPILPFTNSSASYFPTTQLLNLPTATVQQPALIGNNNSAS